MALTTSALSGHLSMGLLSDRPAHMYAQIRNAGTCTRSKNLWQRSLTSYDLLNDSARSLGVIRKPPSKEAIYLVSAELATKFPIGKNESSRDNYISSNGAETAPSVC